MIDFLSKATLVGFMAGAAVIVSLQQLKGLLGISHFTSKMQLIPVMSSVFHRKDEVSRCLQPYRVGKETKETSNYKVLIIEQPKLLLYSNLISI